MNRFERSLGILLHLRSGKEMSASDLAQRLGVSRRTIYRDMDVLSTLGVPVYAERGHAGGFRLLEGYFLPPIMFSKGEAVALLLSLWVFFGIVIDGISLGNDGSQSRKPGFGGQTVS